MDRLRHYVRLTGCKTVRRHAALARAPGVRKIVGISIARTVWPDVADDFDVL